MDNELILHHYESSPYAEKARLMFGYKRLPWRSVNIPVVMPKPDLTALTGGYRRTPVLQVGADIYCDTALIASVLEQRAPEPTLFPAGAPLAPLLAQWIDMALFWNVIVHTMQPAGAAHIFAGAPPEAMKAFAADRAPFAATLRRPTLADATAALNHAFATFEAQLAQAGSYLFGDAPCIADFALAPNIWFVRRGGAEVASVVAARPLLTAWYDRMTAIGHAGSERLKSTQALEIAAAAQPAAPVTVEAGLGFDAGAAVTVAATDYGVDPVAGALVGLTRDSVTVARHDERAGLVHVHFPRRGFQIKREHSA